MRDSLQRDPLRYRTVEHVIFLTRLELRRARRQVVALCGMAAALAVAAYAADSLTAENILVWGFGLSAGFVGTAAINSLRDRLEGTLWLVAVLPVSSRTVAAARFCAGALIVLPAAAIFTIALGALQGTFAMTPWQVLMAGLTAWVFLTGVAWASIVVGLAFSPEKMPYAPTIALALAVGTFYLAGQWIDDPFEFGRSILHHPYAFPASVVGFGVLVAATGYLTFRLAARSISRFDQPVLVRPDS